MNQARFCMTCGAALSLQQIAGRERLACSLNCGYVLWDNPVPVVAGIVEYGDSVILVRNKEWPEKFYGLVTGFLEKNETPEAGILRELQEELSLTGEIDSFLGNYSFFQNNQIIIVFHIHAQGEIVLGEELGAYKLVLPENLRPWSLGTGPALKDWLEKKLSH